MVHRVRRGGGGGGGGDLDNNPPEPQSDGEEEVEESLSIRNESGESLEDLVSIMSSDEVEVQMEKLRLLYLMLSSRVLRWPPQNQRLDTR